MILIGLFTMSRMELSILFLVGAIMIEKSLRKE